MNDLLAYIHWDFNPDIFHIGDRPIRGYGLMFAIGFIIGLRMVEKMFKHEKENMKWIESLLYFILGGTIIGARLGHVFFYGWEHYSQHPIEILYVWQGGLASHGGVAGIFIALLSHSAIYTKRNVFWTIDRVVIPTAIVTMLIRLGNLFNSEIYGIETTLPWGFIFERNGEVVPKHPTQIYEALAYLATFFVVYYMYWKTNAKSKTGLISGVFFIMVFTARFFIEFIKEDQEAFEAGMALNMGQWLSIPIVAGGIILIVWALLKNKPKPANN